MSTAQETLAVSEEYVRNFFMYTDHDNDAIVELFRIGVFRTAAAINQGWEPPTDDERLAKNLEYLKDSFNPLDADPRNLVDSETQLASFPDVYFRIQEVLDNPNSSAEDVAKVVSSDMDLTAKLLKLVNSPFYGLLDTVEDVSHAIALAGVDEVASLALGISAINVFKDIPSELMNMEVFWRHSISAGVFAKLLASKIDGLKADRFFTAGLLHDCGKLITYKKLPYASVQVLLHARDNMLPPVEAEEEMLGFDHAEVAELLLTEWKFPDQLVDMISNHHHPELAKDQMAASIIQLADNMANAMEISSGGMYVLPGLEEGAWEHIPLKTTDLVTTVGLFDMHIEELFRSFL